jgi:polysaccharide pyruvyl transferase WcaK-like protein
MYNVTLLGASLDTGNMGVSALAASLVKLIKEIKPEAHISFFIGGPSAKRINVEAGKRQVDIDIINYRLSPKASLGEHILWLFLLSCIYRIMPSHIMKQKILQSNWRLKSLACSTFVGDIRGGDSFSDIYGVKRLIMGSIPNIIILLLGKKLVLLPQTYGPYQSKPAQLIAKLIIKRATFIISRDREGIETIHKLFNENIDKRPVLFCPDVAFVLDASEPGNSDLFPSAKTETKNAPPVIGLNINGLMYNGGYTRDNMFKLNFDYKLFTHKLSETLMKKTKANLLLIPHTFAPRGHVESDPDACAEVLDTLSPSYVNRVHMISGEYDQHAIKGIIGLCDFFIGSRMHACIAALSQGIPTVGVAYSKKFRGVFDSIDVSHLVIDARDADVDKAIENIVSMYETREQIEETLKNRIDIAKDQLYRVFQEILPPA